MFLTMRQNNSGGYYITNTSLGVGENIIIECDDLIDAEVRFKRIAKSYGSGFYDYCNCCGERWADFEWLDDSDLTESPSIYGTPINDVKYRYIYSGYIHYKTGDIKYFKTKKE